MQIFYISGPKQRGITLDLNDIKGFVKTQPWDDVKVDERAMPVGEWPDGTYIQQMKLRNRCAYEGGWETGCSCLLESCFGCGSHHETSFPASDR